MDRSISCGCLDGDFPASRRRRSFLGTDDRRARISVDPCRRCGRNWRVYRLEARHPRCSERGYRRRTRADVPFSHRKAVSIFGQLRDCGAGGSPVDGNVPLRPGPLDVT